MNKATFFGSALSLFSFFAIAVAPGLARADDKPALDADKADDDARHLRGLELVLRPSFGGAGSGSPVHFTPSPNVQGDPGAVARGDASPYGAGFVGHALLGYRFHPLVSAGMRAGLRTASAAAVSDGTENLARSSWDAGFYARAYPLALAQNVRKHLDPWVGVGVGYMRDVQTFQKSIANVKADWTYDHHAVAVPLGVGVDYRVLPMLSLGPSFEYTLASAVAGCLKASALGNTTTYCSNESPGSSFVKAAGYGVWSAGLDVRATF